MIGHSETNARRSLAETLWKAWNYLKSTKIDVCRWLHTFPTKFCGIISVICLSFRRLNEEWRYLGCTFNSISARFAASSQIQWWNQDVKYRVIGGAIADLCTQCPMAGARTHLAHLSQAGARSGGRGTIRAASCSFLNIGLVLVLLIQTPLLQYAGKIKKHACFFSKRRLKTMYLLLTAQ